MIYRWQRTGLFLEAAKTAAVLIVASLFSLMNPLLSAWQLLLVPLSLLLASHLFSCMVKLVSEVTITPDGVRLDRRWLPSQSLEWKDMTSFEVRSFSLGSFRKKSLTDMKFRGHGASILIDDGLDDFSGALQAAWRAVRANGVSVSDTTRANLQAAGVLKADAN
jgi:hypothetical protein